MNTSIAFQYPSWFILLCLLLGITYALVLYFRSKSFRERSKWLNWLLGIVRGLAVTLISILLLSPLIKALITESKKPIIVLAQDNSESIIANMSADDSLAYTQEIQKLKADLTETYDLKTYTFGDGVKENGALNFTEKVSNISSVLSELYDLYSNQNLGAIILSSDGIYNQGSNPIYTSTRLNAPIYTIALGDTTPQKDLVIKKIYHNRIAYLGDKFSLQVDVAAQNCKGEQTALRIYKGKRKLKEVKLKINDEAYFNTQEIVLDADKSGVQRYRITLTAIKDEKTTVNNTKEVFIDVLDARQKILLLANSPHPDINALKQSISKNKNYQVTIAYKQPKRSVSNFDFVILHQLPSSTNPISSILSEMDNKKIPRLFIMGNQSDIASVNKRQPFVALKGNTKATNEIQALFQNKFSLFTTEHNLAQELPKFPPLLAPFGEFSVTDNANVLLYQKIGSVETQFPLLVFGENRSIKTGILCAEGLWKWRVFDYLQHQNHNIFDELIGKSVQYLTVKEDKRKFRVHIANNIFNENEAISFDAELYNNSYELINDPDVYLSINNSAGETFDYTFNKTTNAYDLNAGYFPVGDYTFKANTQYNGERLNYRGQFSIQPIQLELFETTADHSLLRILSDKYGGQLVLPNAVNSLVGLLKDREEVRPVLYSREQLYPVINLKWLCLLLVGLLVLEWFLRRYFGSY